MDMKVRYLLIAVVLLGCSSSDFGGSSGTSKGKTPEKKVTPDGDDPDDGKGPKTATATGTEDDATDDEPVVDQAIAKLPDEDGIGDDDGEVKAKRCSPDYRVPGMANIWLAGTPNGTSIHYHKGKDDAMPGQGPLLAVPDVKECFKAGAKLYFRVSGQISHGGSPVTSADGTSNENAAHERAAFLGKSNITAPYNALLAVFLGDEDPSSQSPPPDLSFASQVEKDYATLSPKKGQVFFLGDGKTSAGKFQKIVVPEGVTRLYLGIMDSFEWNNNSGELVGAILIEP